MMAPSIWTKATTRKRPKPTSSLRRCVTIVDLTSIGIANTLGVGIHVLLGHAAHDSAGPSIVLSFILLSVSALLSGLCIGELTEQFPDVTGWSSYAYTYAIVGELCAFELGWNALFELAIGSAVAAKAWTQYADLAFFNGTGSSSAVNSFSMFGLVVTTSVQSGDVAAFCLLIVVAIFTSIYVKVVCIVNNVLVVVCVLFLGGTIFVGLFNVDSRNWTGGTGFFPNGLDGILGAVSLTAFSFVGVELMTAMSVEVLESKSYSRLYSTSVGCVFVSGLLLCFASSVVLTLVVPHSALSDAASVARAFVTRGVASMSGFVFVGASCGLFASVLACSMAQGRVLQAMARDGLLPSCARDRGTPLQATIVCGIASALLALLLDVRSLLAMLGFGTLLGMAAAPILVLLASSTLWNDGTHDANVDITELPNSNVKYGSTEPAATPASQQAHDSAVELVQDDRCEATVRTYAVACNQTHDVMDVCCNEDRLPCVPWLPLVCLFLHVVFLVCLPLAAWIRFILWSALGLVLYVVNQARCGDSTTAGDKQDVDVDDDDADDDQSGDWRRPVLQTSRCDRR